MNSYIAAFRLAMTLGLGSAAIECWPQAPHTLWAGVFYGINAPSSVDCAIDQQENVYVLGQFSGNVDFDPGLALYPMSSSNGNIYVAKMNSDGQFLWAIQFGIGTSQPIGIEVDVAGNIVIGGINFSLSADFDPGPTTFTLPVLGGFVLKLTESGTFLWAKSIGGPITLMRDMTIDSDGNVITTGDFQGTIDFDPGPDLLELSSTGINDIFVSKLGSNGQLLWAINIGGTADNDGLAVAADFAGNTYIGGFFTGTTDFDPSPTDYSIASQGGGDAFVCKLSPQGNLVWARSMGGPAANYADAVRSISVRNGQVFSVGAYKESADFDPSLTTYTLNSAGEIDAFVSVLSTSGDFVAAYPIGGWEGNEFGWRVETDALDNLYIHGQFQGTVDFDPGPTVQSLTTTTTGRFLCKWSSQGAFVWAFAVPGITAAVINTQDEIYCIGSCTSTTDVDPSAEVYQAGQPGALVMKLDQTVTTFVTEDVLMRNSELRVSQGPIQGESYIVTFPQLASVGRLLMNDLQGRLVDEIPVQPGMYSLVVDLTNKVPGMYVLSLYTGQEKLTARVERY